MEGVPLMVPGSIGVLRVRTKVGALVVNMGVEGMVVLVMMVIVTVFWGGRHGEYGEGAVMVLELVVRLTMT